MTREYFEGFNYVYFGDVDFVIYNELDDDFISDYLLHCKCTELPFSNGWNYFDGRHRLTGLHFIIKDPYFDEMDDIIRETRIPGGSWFRRECYYDEKSPSWDEEMLFYMASSVFDLRLIKHYPRRHNGLHFGVFRYLYNSPLEEITKLRSEILFDSFQRLDDEHILWKMSEFYDNDVFFSKLLGRANDRVKSIIEKSFSVFKRKLFF